VDFAQGIYLCSFKNSDVHTGLAVLSKDVSILGSEVKLLKTDVAELKTDVSANKKILEAILVSVQNLAANSKQ